MKKSFIYLSVAAFAMLCFTACSDDDEPDKKDPDPVVPVSTGAYILTQGNYWDKIEGSLDVIDYSKSTISQNVFVKANGRSMGATPQCGIAYGSKIYLGMYQSKTIEIIDANTYKSIKQINLPESGFDGTEPRWMVAHNGKIYVSMYDGYVSRLDTLSMAIDASVKVGPNPEMIEIHGNNLYVPNSDGMNHPNYGTTASIVSLDSFKEISTFTVPMNPKQFISVGGNLYLISMGNYNDVAAALYKIESDNTYTEITKATIAASKDNVLYLINFPYGGTPSYAKYDVSSNSLTSLSFDEVPAPTGLGVDPVTGSLIISSYLDNNYESYNLPGNVYQYDNNGKFVKKYDCGIGAPCIFFNSAL
ncbi:MAG: hypothetical protein K2I16_02070 [Muribaculaceae bacterium]|nr:hypothetical protein [Muribaculaceae bacterium]